jgi:hypothetical protein
MNLRGSQRADVRQKIEDGYADATKKWVRCGSCHLWSNADGSCDRCRADARAGRGVFFQRMARIGMMTEWRKKLREDRLERKRKRPKFQRRALPRAARVKGA